MTHTKSRWSRATRETVGTTGRTEVSGLRARMRDGWVRKTSSRAQGAGTGANMGVLGFLMLSVQTQTKGMVILLLGAQDRQGRRGGRVGGQEGTAHRVLGPVFTAGGVDASVKEKAQGPGQGPQGPSSDFQEAVCGGSR